MHLMEVAEYLLQLVGNQSIREVVFFVSVWLALTRVTVALIVAIFVPVPQTYKMSLDDQMIGRITLCTFLYAGWMGYLAWTASTGYPTNVCTSIQCPQVYADLIVQSMFALAILTLMDWNYSKLVNKESFKNRAADKQKYLRTLYANRGLSAWDLVFAIPLLALKYYAAPIAVATLSIL